MTHYSETARERADRHTLVRGCLLGLAYGDALGTAPEAATPSQATALTQLALFTAEGMLRARHRAMLKGIGGAEILIVWESYLRWRGTQNPAYRPEHYQDSQSWPGGWLATEPALHKLSRTGPTTWHELNNRPAYPPGSATNQSMGSDALTRIIPVGLVAFFHPPYAASCAVQLASLTHGHPAAQAAAAWVAVTVAYLSQKQPLSVAARLATYMLPPSHGNESVRHAISLATELVTNPKHPHQSDFWYLMRQRTAGAVLLAGFYHALRYSKQPETALREAAARGGRQAAALTGALLGASLGEAAWPASWRTTLDLGRVVVEIADDLHTEVKGGTYSPDEEWERRYPGW